MQINKIKALIFIKFYVKIILSLLYLQIADIVCKNNTSKNISLLKKFSIKLFIY